MTVMGKTVRKGLKCRELPKCDPETRSEQVWLDGTRKARQRKAQADKADCVTRDLEIALQPRAKGFLAVAVDSPVTTLWGGRHCADLPRRTMWSVDRGEHARGTLWPAKVVASRTIHLQRALQQ